MATYESLINNLKKSWDCPDMMNSQKENIKKIPFSSPLLNYATYGGIPRNKVTEFCGRPGGGKAQPLYSKVLTPTGFIKMGNISIGDTVFDGCGNLCKVIGVYPQGVKDVYEITTQGKNKIRVSSGHLNSVWWWDARKHERVDRVLTTEELISEFNTHKSKKLRIDIPEVDWPERPVPIDPYLLGALLGDGCLVNNGFGFSNCERDVINKVDLLLSEHGLTLKSYGNSSDEMSWSIAYLNYSPNNTKSSLKQALFDLDLLDKRSYEKHIPKIYLYNSKEVRLRLLQGLMDTDGCINCNTHDCSVEFSTSSPQLSEDFAFLVRSLGIRDTVNPSIGKYRDKDGVQHICRMSYQHLLKISNDLQFYTSEKHTARFRPRQQPPMRNIVSIEYVGREECQCIMLDSPLHTYISDDFLVTHNTTTAIDLANNAQKLFKEEHEASINKLRTAVAEGHKEYSGKLQDLIDKGPKKVLYVDLEHTFDFKWAAKMGCNKDDIDTMQPPDIPGEKILQAVKDLIESYALGLVVIDSVPSLVTGAELDKKFGERTVASLAGLMTEFMRKIIPVLERCECTLLLINQERVSMENPYAIQTPGGEAIKFYSTLRMYFRLGSPVDIAGNELPLKTENPAGYLIDVKLLKQKGAAFDRKHASYFLMAQSGLRPDFDYVKLAINNYGLIQKSAGWFTLVDPDTGEVLSDESGKPVKINGQIRVYEYIQTHPDYYESLQKYITNDINSNGVDMGDNEDESVE